MRRRASATIELEAITDATRETAYALGVEVANMSITEQAQLAASWTATRHSMRIVLTRQPAQAGRIEAGLQQLGHRIGFLPLTDFRATRTLRGTQQSR